MAQRILIVQTAFLGDALLAIPLVRRVRQLYPNHEIHLLCRQGFGEFFEKLKLVNKAWEVNKKKSDSRTPVFSELKKYEFDFIFSPHESVRTAILVAQLKSKQKIGFKKWWNFFAFNKTVQKNKNLPDALRQLSILEPVDTDIVDKLKNYSGGVPEWASMSVDLKSINHSLKWQLKQPTLFLAPGSVWATKRWTAEGYAQVAKQYAKTHAIVFVGAKDERELCESLKNQIPGSTNLAGETSILDLLFLFKTGSHLICNDSGAMHVASVAGLPTTAIFGPTVLKLGYQPWQNNAVVVEKALSCRPCGKHGHQACPIGTHACMKDISANDVISKLTDLSH